MSLHVVIALYGEANRSGIIAVSKKKGNHACSECGEFGKEALIAVVDTVTIFN